MIAFLKNKEQFSRTLHSKRTRSVLLYVSFVIIATVFWCIVTFNQLIQQEMTIQVELVDVPNNVTLIDEVPPTVSVTVKDRGLSFLKYMFKDPPTLTLNFSDYCDAASNTVRVNSSQLATALRRLLGRDASISNITPEVINVKYTDQPGKRVRIDFSGLEIKPGAQFAQQGRISYETEWVTVFADPETLKAVDSVRVQPVREVITETFSRDVDMVPIANAKIVPQRVRVTIPIEPLNHKNRDVTITLLNQPADTTINFTPSIVKVSYMVPISQARYEQNEIEAVVDFRQIDFRRKYVRFQLRPLESETIIGLQPTGGDSVQYEIVVKR